jgi:hypothetical protein
LHRLRTRDALDAIREPSPQRRQDAPREAGQIRRDARAGLHARHITSFNYTRER